MNNVAVIEHQKELYDLINRIKKWEITAISELKPLRIYVYRHRRVSYLCREDREEILSMMLISIVNGEFWPVEYQTYRYLSQRLLNAMLEGGFIKETTDKEGKKKKSRYKIAKMPPMSRLFDNGTGYREGLYENTEIKLEISQYLDRMVG